MSSFNNPFKAKRKKLLPWLTKQKSLTIPQILTVFHMTKVFNATPEFFTNNNKRA